MKDDEQIILKHYMTKNRYGDKGIVPEVVDPNSATAKLLRRIEEKRLGADCHKAIDMRGKVPGSVSQHKHKGMTHYLDVKGKKIFEDTCKKHGGRFTVEAFEKVTEADHTFKAQQKKETKERLKQQRAEQLKKAKAQQARMKAMAQRPGKTGASTDSQSDTMMAAEAQEQAEPELQDVDVVDRGTIAFDKFVRFGDVCIREEPRMTYSTKVFIQPKDGEPLFGRTVDISTGGVQVSTEELEDTFERGQVLSLHYEALEKEVNESGLKSEYEIVDVYASETKTYIKLNRIPSGDDRAFVNFFESFIEKNKRRYKTDCQDLVDRIRSRMFEQSYCLNLTSIPLLVSVKNDEFVVLGGLHNEENKKLEHELIRNLTANSVSAQHLAQYAVNAKRRTGMGDGAWRVTVFSFISIKEKELYLACASDFGDAREMNLFIRLAQQNNKFRAYQCLVSEIEDEKKTKALTILHSMPNYHNLKYESSKDFIDSATHTVTIYDVTASLNAINFPDEEFNEKNAAANFTCYKTKATHHEDLQLFNIDFRRGRKEERYLYETEATVAAKGKSYNGETKDFSIKGLCVVLDSPCLLSIGTKVDVGLPTFAKKTKDKNLKHIEYEIVAMDDSKKRVSMIRKVAKTAGVDFFKSLIDKNKDKLEVCNREDILAFKTKVTQLLVMEHLLSVPFFVGKGEKVAHELKTIGYSCRMDTFNEAFQVGEDAWDIPYLLDDEQFRMLLKDQRRCQDVGKTYSTDVYILQNEDGSMVSKIAKQLEGDGKLKAFWERCQKAKRYYCFHLVINDAGKLNKLDFEEDMSQVRVRSLAKHKILAEQMDNITVVGDAFDVTGSLPHVF